MTKSILTLPSRWLPQIINVCLTNHSKTDRQRQPMTCRLQYVEHLNVVHKMCGQPPILRLSPQRWLRVCLWVVPLWLDHPVKESNALHQWRNYNFWAPWQHSLITVLIHNLGHFGPLGLPALPGLPMARYTTALH